jgi:hypothetical protein
MPITVIRSLVMDDVLVRSIRCSDSEQGSKELGYGLPVHSMFITYHREPTHF